MIKTITVTEYISHSLDFHSAIIHCFEMDGKTMKCPWVFNREDVEADVAHAVNQCRGCTESIIRKRLPELVSIIWKETEATDDFGKLGKKNTLSRSDE